MGMGMGYFGTPMSGYYHQMAPAMTGMASQYMGSMYGMTAAGMTAGMGGMQGAAGQAAGINLASSHINHSPFSLGELEYQR